MIDERELHAIAARLPSEWRWLGTELRRSLALIHDNLSYLERPMPDTPRVRAVRLRLTDRVFKLVAAVERIKSQMSAVLVQ